MPAWRCSTIWPRLRSSVRSGAASRSEAAYGWAGAWVGMAVVRQGVGTWTRAGVKTRKRECEREHGAHREHRRCGAGCACARVDSRYLRADARRA
ncbi:hypothetical protein PSP6_590002 [Paraburkholderia tropica]|nr:hypothetical protein PSP6_590002 [Paraburkholderia tropica]